MTKKQEELNRLIKEVEDKLHKIALLRIEVKVLMLAIVDLFLLENKE